eukprot:497842-Prorocentrum_minimum.AAC.1
MCGRMEEALKDFNQALKTDPGGWMCAHQGVDLRSPGGVLTKCAGAWSTSRCGGRASRAPTFSDTARPSRSVLVIIV